MKYLLYARHCDTGTKYVNEVVQYSIYTCHMFMRVVNHLQGWPSFRTGEFFSENVHISEDNLHVYSSCGTYLGGFNPDERGERYCIDLSCISGVSKK